MNRIIFEEDDTQLIGKFLKDIYYPHSKKYKLDMEKNRRKNVVSKISITFLDAK